jgi:uncharacterized protein (DUF885 family)
MGIRLFGSRESRAFHAEVLNTGALPLQVLESKIRTWIDANRM